MGAFAGEEESRAPHTNEWGRFWMRVANYPRSFPVTDLFRAPDSGFLRAVKGFFRGYHQVSTLADGDLLKVTYACRASIKNSEELAALYRRLTGEEVKVKPGIEHTLELLVNAELGNVEIEVSVPRISVNMPQEMLEAVDYNTAAAIRSVI